MIELEQNHIELGLICVLFLVFFYVPDNFCLFIHICPCITSPTGENCGFTKTRYLEASFPSLWLHFCHSLTYPSLFLLETGSPVSIKLVCPILTTPSDYIYRNFVFDLR